MFPIIGNVTIELGLPPFGAGFWGGGTFASFMPVPEATVYEDDGGNILSLSVYTWI